MLDLTLLAVRLLIGLLFIGHGLQKYNTQTAEYMEKWFIHKNLPFPGLLVKIARSWEVVGGVFLVIGFAPGPWLIIAVMIGAIYIAHKRWSPWLTQDKNSGWEYCAVLIAICTLLIVTGMGKYAIDAILP